MSIIIVIIPLPAMTQNIGPVIQEEKRPTIKDPTYKSSVYPFFLRKRTELTPLQNFILQPNQSLDQFLLNQAKPEKKDYKITPNEEELLLNHKEYYIQKYLLPQLGNDSYINVHQQIYLEPPKHNETKWERRYIIFMLSLPVTSAISYGILRVYKNANGFPQTLDKNESIGLFLFASLFSAYIVYYDEQHFKGIYEYAKELQKNKISKDEILNKD